MNCSNWLAAQRGGIRLWLAFVLLLAVLAVMGYQMVQGGFGKLNPGAPQGAASASSGALKPLSDEQLERMVSQAELQAKQDPKNASAWALLAHSYEMMGKFSESARAYATLVQLLPKDAQVLADYADVLAVSNGRSFKGEPFALLQKALALDAKNVKALLLAGNAYVEAQDGTQALRHLERARAAATDPALLREIDASMAQAQALVGGAVAAPASAPAAPVKAATEGLAGASAQVAGKVWLADGLRAKAPPQATLFLYARPVEGSRMPVALMRKKVSDLPFDFSLDDSMAMTPTASLSKQSRVVVVARISLRGNVTPAAGDLEGVSAPVALGTKNLKLEISEVVK